MRKHISYIVISLVVILILSFGFQVNAQSLPTVTMDKPIKDMSISELQAKIAEILSVIQQLQALIAQLQGGGVGVSCNFYRNLYPGISGSDVKCLQQYLNNAGHTLANSGPGSPSNETIYYGSLTRAAVKKWQDANNIEQGVWWGYFGPKSQAKYNELAATGEQEEPPTPPLSGTYCGDNIAQRPSDQGTIEDCDGTDIRNKTCISQGYTGGTLLCSNDCSFNTSQCLGTGPDIPTPPLPGPTTSCGDSIMQKPNSEGIYEVCDSTNLGTSTCLTYGYVGGTLSCSSNCITFNTSNCTISSGGGGGGGQTPVVPVCGDNTDNICPSGCTNSQDDDCTYCGDNVLQRPNDEGILEVCDNTKLDNQTCITKGFSGGTLQCSNTCLTFDTSSCTLPEPPNEAPVLNLIGNKTINENSTLSFTVSGTDPDGDVLSYSVQDRPSGATFSSQTFTWTPTYEQSGTYNVIFTVSDGILTDTETITITVSNVNRDPILNPIGDKAVQQNNTLTFTISGTDPDNDTLTYTASGLASGASFNSSTRTFSWTPSNTGTYNTTFTVSDGSLTDLETIFITVTSAPVVNNAPVANNQAISLDEDNLVNITLSATDLDGDDLTYAIVSNPSQGTLSGTAPSITYTPNTNYNGFDSFTFRANDGQEDSNTATISLTINPVNDAPVLNSIGNKTVDENQQLSFTVSGTDIDGDTLYYSIQDTPSGASFNSSTRTFTWTPSYTQSGTYTPTFIVSDTALTDQETITITVNNVVTGPVCGDSICEGIETCSTCEADCGVCPTGFPTDYISYWKFDGDATDETGTNNGTLVGDAHIVSDAERGQVLSLDGSGDYVDTNSDNLGLVSSNDVSISAWIKTAYDYSPESGYIVNDYDRSAVTGWSLIIKKGNEISGINIQGSGSDQRYIISGSTYNDGNWHHVVVVIHGDGSDVDLYVDNIDQGTSTLAGTVNQLNLGSGNVVIGKQSTPDERFFNGLIDDVMIFNRSLSEAEILQIYNSQNECQQNSDCNDNNDCTINTCVGVGGAGADSRGCAISFVNAGISCDDDLFCTTAGTSTCDGTGSCVGGTLEDCSDAVACTDDVCVEGPSSCIHQNTANDSNCSSGYICDVLLNCVLDPCDGIDFCSDYTDSGNCNANTCSVSGPGCEWNSSSGICEEREAGAWTPPIGIPHPGWGIETTHWMYSGKTYNYVGDGGVQVYRESDDGPYTHYIKPSDPNATDADNPYGTVAKPRLTLNMYNWHAAPAGSVFQIWGPIDTVQPSTLTFGGTAEAPVFVRGRPGFEPVWTDDQFTVDASYVVFENIKFVAGENNYNFIRLGVRGNTMSNIAIRNCEFSGGSIENGILTAIEIRNYLGSVGPGTISNVVVYNNYFHNMCDDRTEVGLPGQEATGVYCEAYSSNVWIVDNLFHHLGSDGVQIAHDYHPNIGAARPHHIYVGRNVFHDNGENAVDLKKCADIIISENIAYNFGSEGYDLSNSNSYAFRYGKGASQNYAGGRERIWTIYNTVFNTSSYEGAFGTHSITGKTEPIATEQYYIGNIVYNAHKADGGAIGFKGGTTTKAGYINNIVYDADLGLSWLTTNQNDPNEEIIIVNNIFSEGFSSYRGYLDMWTLQAGETTYAPLIMSNNIFYQASGPGELTFRMWDGEALVYETFSMAEFISDERTSGFAGGSFEANPLFVAPITYDFELQAASPAIGAATAIGVVDAVFDRFEELYGIDIRVDHDGNPRTVPWDIGAYESGASPARISQTDEKINNLASVLSSIRSEVQDILKRIQELF